MKKITLLFTLMMMFALAGCNTVQGFGKDVKKAGEAVENAGKK
ncbi:entericidin A/B family lipoprotein [Undibacterium danionis]|uniref:Entericidin A/B family lipoprotein n=1 Tax=Undibacterium danionis TaxID=1812100 RepID=A0ABV6IGW8_9BURK